jgi:hypothetical protein
MSTVDLSTPCILIPGMKTNNRGYGPHRKAYKVIYGDIPDDYVVDHACHNADQDCLGGLTCLHRRCFNPLHWELRTLSENRILGKADHPLVTEMRRASLQRLKDQEDRTSTLCPCGAGPFQGSRMVSIHQGLTKCQEGGLDESLYCPCGAGPYKSTRHLNTHRGKKRCSDTREQPS